MATHAAVFDRYLRYQNLALGFRGGIAVREHRAAEAMRPAAHAGVVVRRRDRDRGEAAATLDRGRHVVIDERQAVPHHQPLAGRHE